MQGHGAGASRGSTWQVRPVIEKLQSHFEDIRQKFNIPPPSEELQVTLADTQNAIASQPSSPKRRRRQALQAPPTPSLTQSEPTTSQEHRLLYSNVNAGWAKLDKDYTLTDLSVSHVAAVDLHPVYTWRYLEKK